MAGVFEAENGIVPCGDASRRGSGEGRGGEGGVMVIFLFPFYPFQLSQEL